MFMLPLGCDNELDLLNGAGVRLLLERNADGVCVVDADLVIRYANSRISGLLGYSPQELVGRSALEVVHESSLAAVEATHAAVMSDRMAEQGFQIRINRKDGVAIWVKVATLTIANADGAYLGSLCLLSDITDVKQAEEEKRRAWEQFYVVFRRNPNPMGITDSAGVVVDVNDSFIRTFGYPLEKVIGAEVSEIGIWANPADLTAARKVLDEQGFLRNFEARQLTEDGRILVGLLNCEYIEIGGRRHRLTTMTDITVRNQAEEDKRQAWELFTVAFRRNPVPMTITHLNGRIIDANTAYQKLTGFKRTELVGLTALERGLVHDPDGYLSMLSDIASSKPVYNRERWLRTRTGEVRSMLKSAELVEIGGMQVVLTSCLDITEHKQAEEEKRKAWELFTVAFRRNPCPMLISDIEGRLVDANEPFEKLFGYSVAEMQGRSPRELGVVVNPAQFDGARQEAVSGKQHMAEFQIKARSGEIKTVLSTLETIEIGGQRLGIGTMIDITDWKQAEEEKRQAHGRFRTIFHRNPSPMIMLDNQGRFVDINETYLKITGYAREELIGKKTDETAVIIDPDELYGLVSQLKSQGSIHGREVNIRTKTGDIRTMLCSIEELELESEKVYLAAMIDITEARRLQDEMVKLERLSAVAQMAASLGHEVRNPLTTVKGYLQLMERKPAFQEHAPKLRIMVDELDRANTIISEYLGLARDRQEGVIQTDINKVIDALFPLIQADALQTGKQATIRLKPLPPVDIDPRELRQIILNLARNGLEAMDAGGTLTIATFSRGSRVVVSVRDEGRGIPAAIRRELGTPFFSTKENGTGLGLSVCYRLAERYSATIDYESNETGTVFYVSFVCKDLSKEE